MNNLSEYISQLNARLNGLVWGLPMMGLIVGVGLFFSILTGFPQLRNFGYAMKQTIGKAFRKDAGGDKGAVSPFQAVTTALAGTVGTGNIAGVAGAIALGGPGAVFWMWVSALFGMATKYAEILLAVKFRKRNAKGDWIGGPMYYITGGLGKPFRWLALCFSFTGAIAALGVGNMVQINTAVESIVLLIDEFTGPRFSGGLSDSSLRLLIGGVFAIISALVLLGGIQRIGKVTETLVPAMSVLYIAGTAAIIVLNFRQLGPALSDIFIGAFSPRAVMGGAFGVGLTQAIRFGVGRGVFSNEAGLGSSPMAHAATSETDPAVQGLFGIFEVFADTIVICSLTALAILTSGVTIPYGQTAGAELTLSAFQTAFGNHFSAGFIAFETALFAFATILSWALYGTRCTEYLLGSRFIPAYKILFVAFVLVGACIQMKLVWEIADTLNGLMAIPNLIAIFLLSGHVYKATRAHFSSLRRKK